MGIDYTQKKLGELVDHNQSLIPSYLFSPRIKRFFDLEQAVIWKKFRFMLFPFTLTADSSNAASPQTEFVTRAEFYLPTMALISFVLISCFHDILADVVFDPNTIVDNVSKCLLLSFFEAVLAKFAFLVAVRVSIPFMDILAFGCYKYIGLV